MGVGQIAENRGVDVTDSKFKKMLLCGIILAYVKYLVYTKILILKIIHLRCDGALHINPHVIRCFVVT
jgi:hypothetical protein